MFVHGMDHHAAIKVAIKSFAPSSSMAYGTSHNRKMDKEYNF